MKFDKENYPFNRFSNKCPHHVHVAVHLFSTRGGRCPVAVGNQPQFSLRPQRVSLSTSLPTHVLAPSFSLFLILASNELQSKGQRSEFRSEKCQRQTDRRLTVHRSCIRRLIRLLSCGRRDKGSGGSSSPEWSNQDSNTSSSRSIRSILALIWW